MIGARYGSAPKPDAGADGAPTHPASDPAWVKAHYLDPRGVDIAVLTGSLLSLGVQPNADLAAALASAINQWTLETWVRPYPCYRGSILVAQQDPRQAVAEIDRLGDDPGMVQVLMGSASEAPLGRRMYHPIFAACVAPSAATGAAHRRRGCRRLATGDRRRPPHHLFRVVRLAAPELHGSHHEHGHRGRVRALSDAERNPVRRRRLLAAPPDVALRQELEGPAFGDALGQAGPQSHISGTTSISPRTRWRPRPIRNTSTRCWT